MRSIFRFLVGKDIFCLRIQAVGSCIDPFQIARVNFSPAPLPKIDSKHPFDKSRAGES